MINNSFNTVNNVFKDFPQMQLGTSLVSGVKTPISQLNKDSLNINNSIASVNVSDTKKKKGKGFWAATVGSSILTAGIITLAIVKGLGAGGYKRISKIIESLNSKIDTGALSERSISVFESAKLAFLKGARTVLSGIKASANFTAVKDSTSDFILHKNSKTGKIADKITALFQKCADSSVDSAYNKVHIKTDDFYSYLTDSIETLTKKDNTDLSQIIEIKGVSKTLQEWLDDLSVYSSKMKESFNNGFSKKARLDRNKTRVGMLSGLNDKVRAALWHDNGGILNLDKKNLNKFKSYITEDIVMGEKQQLRRDINTKRKAFSNNIMHNFTTVKTNVSEISDKLLIEDKTSKDILSQISQKMNAYKTISGDTEIAQRTKLVDEICSDFQNFLEVVKKSGSYDDAALKSIKAQVDFVTQEVLKNDKKGSLEEIITILNGLNKQSLKGTSSKIVDDSTIKFFDKSAKELSDSINKATSLESNDLFDKMAEFKVGSAPTDVMGLLVPLGVGAVAISSAEDKNERVSTTLTTGIPLLGSIATMVYGTTKMLAGTKNLVLAMGVGAVLNTVGNICDKLYKEYQEKQSFAKMAIDAYKHNPLFNASTKIQQDSKNPSK